MNLIGKKVTLRAIEEKDLEMLLESINDPETEKYVGGYSFPTSMKQQKEWFDKNSNDNHNIRMMIETKNDGVVGFANIINIDWKNRTASHGVKIFNKELRSKGIGTDTVMAIMRYCFEELNLNKLEGAIIAYNKASINLYITKCGWKVEGTRRKSIFKNNAYHDDIIMGILKEEYHQLIEHNKYWENE